MSDEIDRKIAVIFATDIVGYSKHMEADESETVKNLRACEKILTQLFKKHGGSLFNTGGDSFLAEFPSAVAAVECAVEFQNEIKTRNASDKTTVPLKFRIGVNSGDVIKEKGNLLGDGVNIAARLEALAQTGGVTISKGVYDYVKGKTKHEYNDLGIQKVKQNEFHAHDLLLDPSQKRKLKTQKSNMPLIGVITVVLSIGLVGLLYFNFFAQDINNKQFNDSNKISLLLLPFKLQSKGDEGSFMAESITGHISTTLAKFDELFLFDESSAVYFVEKNFKYSDLNSEYGVQFLLEGSVQTVKSKVRVNIKLKNLEKNSIIWTDILDFEGKDIFEVQDAISNSILENIIPGALSLTVADARTKQKFTPEVHLNRLKGRVAYESRTAEGLNEYERLLSLNRELEPNNPYLDMDEAWLLMAKVWFGFADDVEKKVSEAYKLTLNTVSADPDFAYASNLAAMIERNHLGELSKACNRIDKLLKISKDESNISMVANLTRHCKEYQKSLDLFKKVLNKAPHFALWFKKDYAWTFLISSFDNDNYDYSEAKDYVKSQLLKNYSEDGINEMWMTMLGYINFKAGNKKSALKVIEKQKKMDFPVNITWKDSYPPILNENENFKKDFFHVLNELGVEGLK